jgi:hypothetical protein
MLSNEEQADLLDLTWHWDQAYSDSGLSLGAAREGAR